jgi:hypothetical protein
MSSHIPEGFHTVTPYAVVHGVARLLDFLRVRRGVRIGGSMLEMGEPSAEWQPIPCTGLRWYVPDAQAVYARDTARGRLTLRAQQ